MEYFIMEEDSRIMNRVVLQKFPKNNHFEYDTSQAERFRMHTGLYTIDNDKTVFPDIISNPIYMVSKTVKEVLTLYDERAVYKTVSLMNTFRRTSVEYAVMLVDRIECLHESAEFYPDNSIKRLVLDKDKVCGHALFRIAGIGPDYPVVSLDVAESLIRRKCVGIKFTKIEVK